MLNAWTLATYSSVWTFWISQVLEAIPNNSKRLLYFLKSHTATLHSGNQAKTCAVYDVSAILDCKNTKTIGIISIISAKCSHLHIYSLWFFENQDKKFSHSRVKKRELHHHFQAFMPRLLSHDVTKSTSLYHKVDEFVKPFLGFCTVKAVKHSAHFIGMSSSFHTFKIWKSSSFFRRFTIIWLSIDYKIAQNSNISRWVSVSWIPREFWAPLALLPDCRFASLCTILHNISHLTFWRLDQLS